MRLQITRDVDLLVPGRPVIHGLVALAHRSVWDGRKQEGYLVNVVLKILINKGNVNKGNAYVLL